MSTARLFSLAHHGGSIRAFRINEPRRGHFVTLLKMFDPKVLDAMTAGASPVSINFNRMGDAFTPTLFANPKPGVALPPVSVEEMREMVDWAVGRGFFVWHGWVGWLANDATAVEAARAFCEVLDRPIERVTVERAPPTPERPDMEPHGQVTIKARIRGIEVVVASTSTSTFDHDAVEARFVADAQSLAALHGASYALIA